MSLTFHICSKCAGTFLKPGRPWEWVEEGRLNIRELTQALSLWTFLFKASHSPSYRGELPQAFLNHKYLRDYISTTCFYSQGFLVYAFSWYVSYIVSIHSLSVSLLLQYICERNWVICSVELPTFWILLLVSSSF